MTVRWTYTTSSYCLHLSVNTITILSLSKLLFVSATTTRFKKSFLPYTLSNNQWLSQCNCVLVRVVYLFQCSFWAAIQIHQLIHWLSPDLRHGQSIRPGRTNSATPTLHTIYHARSDRFSSPDLGHSQSIAPGQTILQPRPRTQSIYRARSDRFSSPDLGQSIYPARSDRFSWPQTQSSYQARSDWFSSPDLGHRSDWFSNPSNTCKH